MHELNKKNEVNAMQKLYLEQYINTKETAELLGIARRTITQWCKNEKIPYAVKISGIWLINKPALLKWLKENEQPLNHIWLKPKYKR